MLPVTSFAEEEGSVTNSSRVIQWKWKAADPYFESRTDIDILSDLFVRMRKMYEKDGGKGKEAILAVDWSYKDPLHPSVDELQTELNGKALTDLKDAEGKVVRAAGQRLASFGEMARRTVRPMAASGSTQAFIWSDWQQGLTSRQQLSIGLGVYGNWGFSWPANRRIQYNRASADPDGKPWSEAKKYMYWNGERWTGPDVPDYVPTIPPERAVGPFIMNAEGVSRLWVRGLMADGPFPVHMEPFESPVPNLVFPKLKQPEARVFKNDMEARALPKDFPIVGTTYRFTEHFHYWTKLFTQCGDAASSFREMSEEHAKEKATSTDSAFGSVQAREVRARVVTKRLSRSRSRQTVQRGGAAAQLGFIANQEATPINSLTSAIGDSNRRPLSTRLLSMSNPPRVRSVRGRAQMFTPFQIPPPIGMPPSSANRN